MACADLPIFKIRDNILLGEKVPIDKSINIGDLILTAFKCKPDFIGQIDAETREQTTFQQMRESSVKCAMWLKSEGFGAHSTIAICTYNQLNAYIPFLASLYIGATVNPWNPEYLNYNTQRLSLLLKNQPDIIFIDNYNIGKLYDFVMIVNTCMRVVTFGDIPSFVSIEKILQLYANVDEVELSAFSCVQLNDTKKIAVTTYSSTWRNYNGDERIPYIAFTSPSNQESPVMFSNDVGLWYGNFTWSHSVLLTVRAIFSFVTAIKSSVFNEEKLYQQIEKYKVTWVFLEKHMCDQLREMDSLIKYDVSSLEKVLCDSAINDDIHKNLVKSLPNASIIQVYSKPETGVIAYQRGNRKIGSSGYVGKNISLIIVDIYNMIPLGPNEFGRIMCRSPCISEYQTSREKVNISKDSAQCDVTQGWFDTEDGGYYDEDGEIFVTGKWNSIIIRCDNKRFVLSKIEDQLRRHPAVSNAIVVPIPHRSNNCHLRAYVEITPGKQVTKNELMQYAENLGFKLDAGLRLIVGKMPCLPDGKVDQVQVRCTPYKHIFI